MKQYIGTKIIEAEPAYRCMDGQGRVTITDDPSEAFPQLSQRGGRLPRPVR